MIFFCNEWEDEEGDNDVKKSMTRRLNSFFFSFLLSSACCYKIVISLTTITGAGVYYL